MTAEELLAGADLTYDVTIAENLINPMDPLNRSDNIVRIKPLSIGTFQLIMKSAREDPGLIPILIVKEGVAEPPLSLAQVKKMPIGLLEFLLEEIRTISGMTKKKTP